jgi:hypothetical protein
MAFTTHYVFRCITTIALLSALAINTTTAGPAEYTVTRSVDQDETTCEESRATISLTGAGPGAGTETLTIVKSITPGFSPENLVISDNTTAASLRSDRVVAFGFAVFF